MLRFVFGTIWIVIISSIVCFVMIKLLLPTVLKDEASKFSDHLENKVENRYKDIKKKHLSGNSLKKLRKRIFD